MSSRSWYQRVQDILEAIFGIQRRTTGKTLEDIQHDETLAKAILYDFMIMGEAARNVPSKIQLRYPTIPWRLMGDMRNVAAHEYFQIDIATIWETIQNDLPMLVPASQELLDSEVD